MSETTPKPLASNHAYQLSDAVTGMAARYGDSMHCQALAFAAGSGSFADKPWKYYERAARRQFRALQRLTRALRDLDA